MGRWIGIDYGTKGIGLAVSDAGAALASAEKTLSGSGNATADSRRVRDWAAEYTPEGYVVGLPLNMNGTAGSQAQISRKFAAALHALTSRPVELWDERLTTFQADEYLREAGVRAARDRKGRQRRKLLRDSLAAQIILQSFLDARRGPDRQTDAAADSS